MKTLENHVIMFDAECPMCRLYTGAFVKTGMLGADGRIAYQTAPANFCPAVDRQRAVNEIALVDTETGEVSYGIASLFKVIGNSFPVFKGLFNCRSFVGLMTYVYAFISYNRRVIIPGSANDTYDIQPSFRLGYRLAYLAVTCALVGFILTHYAGLLTPLVPIGAGWREYAICSGQVFFQALVISIYHRERLWDYLGNMMTISAAGALLLLPVLMLSNLLAVPAELATVNFLLVAGLMLLEHQRRCKLLKLGWLPTVTWLSYRLVLLLMIVKLHWL